MSVSSFASRLRLRLRRGAALFEGLLALGVLAVVMVWAAIYADSRQQALLEEEAGRQVAILGAAAAHYARTHFTDGSLGDPIGGCAGCGRFTFAHLQSGDGILPAGFPEADAMRRDLRIWYRREGTAPRYDRILVLAGQSNFEPEGDTRTPYRALFQNHGRVHLGMVRRTGCPAGLTAPCLVGPTVAESLTDPFDRSFVDDGGVMAFYRFTRQEYCGELVLREANPACPDSGTIAGDLDMGGQRLGGVGTLDIGDPGSDGRAHELAVREDMEVTGAFTLDMATEGDGLAVGRDLEVESTLTVSGALSVYGDVAVHEDLTVNNDFGIRGDLDVTHRIDRMRTIDVSGDMEVSGSDEGLNVQDLHVGSCPNCTN